jgi:hypothetical protein
MRDFRSPTSGIRYLLQRMISKVVSQDILFDEWECLASIVDHRVTGYRLPTMHFRVETLRLFFLYGMAIRLLCSPACRARCIAGMMRSIKITSVLTPSIPARGRKSAVPANFDISFIRENPKTTAPTPLSGVCGPRVHLVSQ